MTAEEVVVAVDLLVGKEGEGVAAMGAVTVVVLSWQPNHPGVSQVVEGFAEADVTDVVTTVVVVKIGAGAALGVDTLSLAEDDAVVVGSLQPNQPGVLQVDVDVDVDKDDEKVDVVVAPVVVLSSRHPHHPGVLQVSVRVRVTVLVLEVLEVVVSVPLLSKYFHLKQSWQSRSS